MYIIPCNRHSNLIPLKLEKCKLQPGYSAHLRAGFEINAYTRLCGRKVMVLFTCSLISRRSDGLPSPGSRLRHPHPCPVHSPLSLFRTRLLLRIATTLSEPSWQGERGGHIPPCLENTAVKKDRTTLWLALERCFRDS